VRHLATHKPKLNSCDTCRRAKVLRAKHIRILRKAENRIRKSRGLIPEKFGDQVTLDHIIARDEHNRGFKGQTSALTLMDRATGFRWGTGLRQTEAGPTWRSCKSSRDPTLLTRSSTCGRTLPPRSVKPPRKWESAVTMIRPYLANHRVMA
jgi:hypothetical protein